MPDNQAGYRWYVGALRTGKISRQVDLTGARFATSFDYGTPGTLEGSFPLRSVDAATGLPLWPTARADTAPGKQFLAVSYVDNLGTETFLEGGPIWQSRYDDTSGDLQIGASGISTHFDHRKVQPTVTTGEISQWKAVHSGAQLGVIAKRLIDGVADDYVGEPVPFPIVTPSDAELGGATPANHVLTYPQYELGWAGERIKQLTQRQDGPEIQLVPRRKSSDPRYLEWVARIGVEPDLMLTQDGPPWRFDRTVLQSQVRDIDISTDGTNLATHMWAAGEGEAEGRPIAFESTAGEPNGLLAFGWPVLEGEVTSTDTVSELTTLRQYALEGLARSSRPLEQWTVVVSRDGRPNVGQYRPGDWAELPVRSHDYIPDGDYAMRILGIAGGEDSEEVTLTMSERLGEV